MAEETTKDEASETKKKEAAEVSEKIAKSKEAKGQKKFKIMIRSQSGTQGKDPIFLGDNGREYQIPRETEVEITESMLNGLRDAVSHDTEEYKGEGGERLFRQRPYQLYPFEILSEVKG